MIVSGGSAGSRRRADASGASAPPAPDVFQAVGRRYYDGYYYGAEYELQETGYYCLFCSRRAAGISAVTLWSPDGEWLSGGTWPTCAAHWDPG
jgi:Zn-dependent M28 family amino/carboxypeptidase